jgi:hypothetical protein
LAGRGNIDEGLRSPEVIYEIKYNKIVAFENVIQVELKKTRWEEIKKTSNTTTYLKLIAIIVKSP